MEGNGALAITVVNRTDSAKIRGGVASGEVSEEVRGVTRKLLGAMSIDNEGESDGGVGCDIDDNECVGLARDFGDAGVADGLSAGVLRAFRT